MIAYLAFSLAFFDLENQNKRVLKIWRQSTYLFIFFLFIELLVVAIDGNRALLWQIQHNFTLVRFAVSFYCIYNIRFIQSPLRSFYLIGTILLWIGILISKIFPSSWTNHDVLYLNPFFYTLVFASAEIVCFTIGLSYRSNFLLAQKQGQYNQERLEKEQIRNHIAADLHDDMGAGLSTIRLLGTRAQLGTDSAEKNTQIQKITAQANDLIEKMSTIIWAMNTEKDTITSLVEYLRYYAFDYLKDTHDLNLQFPMPDLPPSVSTHNLSGDDRREIFLTVKEALHNIVKHAEATTVTMSISLKDKDLEIHIHDDGKELFELNNMGNGLKNMAKFKQTDRRYTNYFKHTPNKS
jgi:signal transduction histidine kinase